MSPPRLRIWHTCGSRTQYDQHTFNTYMWFTYQEELCYLFFLCLTFHEEGRNIKSKASPDTDDPEQASRYLVSAEDSANEPDDTELLSEEESQYNQPRTSLSF